MACMITPYQNQQWFTQDNKRSSLTSMLRWYFDTKNYAKLHNPLDHSMSENETRVFEDKMAWRFDHLPSNYLLSDVVSFFQANAKHCGNLCFRKKLFHNIKVASIRINQEQSWERESFLSLLSALFSDFQLLSVYQTNFR